PLPVLSPVLSNVQAPAIDPVPVPTPARQVLVVRAPAPPPIAISTAVGKLAVSSPLPAEIYAGDRYIGSTPTTLEVPAGRQTLEYRHGDLRTAVSHEIKPDETATATVAFSVSLQINANPWAQVFLDGAQRRPLGQTPLSDISVPIGGVLVFENPNFPAKSHRITEKDTAIQVNFPERSQMLGIVFVLLTTVQAVAQPAPQDEVKDALAHAEALYYAARFSDSIALLTRIDDLLKTQPGRQPEKIDTKLRLALAHIGLNDTAQAKSDFMEVYALSPGYALDADLFSPTDVAVASDAKADQFKARCSTAQTEARARVDAGQIQSF